MSLIDTHSVSGTAQNKAGSIGRRGSSDLTYMPGLDGVRGTAIALVLGSHASIPFMTGGGVGVDIFFVLSGFLISSILLAEFRSHGRIDMASFYWRRSLRIIPPLLSVCLGLCIAAPFAGISWVILRSDFVATLTFVSDYTRADRNVPLYLAPTWSLSVEEQFYLLWPACIWGLMRTGWSPRRIVSLLIGAAIAIAIWRFYRFTTAANLVAVYDNFDTRVDALLWGSALAFLPAEHLRKASLPWPAALAILLGHVVFSHWDQPWLYLGGMTVGSLSATVLIAAAASRSNAMLSIILENAPLRWLGRISYSVYLWHYPPLLMLFLAGNRGIVLLVIIPVGIVLGAMSYYFVERPALTLKTIDWPWLKLATALVVPTLFMFGLFYVLPSEHP